MSGRRRRRSVSVPRQVMNAAPREQRPVFSAVPVLDIALPPGNNHTTSPLSPARCFMSVSPTRVRFGSSLLCLSLVLGLSAARAQEAPRAPAADALPPGAVARLGDGSLWHGADIRAVAFAPGRNVLASHGSDDKVCLWHAVTGKLLRRLDVPGGDGEKLRSPLASAFHGPSLLFSGDGKAVALADVGGRRYHVWEAATGKALYQVPMPVPEPQPNALPAGLALAAKLRRMGAGPFALSPDARLL